MPDSSTFLKDVLLAARLPPNEEAFVVIGILLSGQERRGDNLRETDQPWKLHVHATCALRSSVRAMRLEQDKNAVNIFLKARFAHLSVVSTYIACSTLSLCGLSFFIS